MLAIIYIPTVHGSAVMTYHEAADIAAILERKWSAPTIQTRIIGLTYADFQPSGENNGR